MRGSESVALAQQVGPGETVNLSLELTSPMPTGIHFGQWVLESADGIRFGNGANADQPVRVILIVGPEGMTAPGGWRAEFFGNCNLGADPILRRTDAVIDFKWLLGSPGSGVPTDRFLARWTGKPKFEMGTYRFRVRAEDGVRLFVDDELVVDEWTRAGGVESVGATVSLARGANDVRLEYRENLSEARVRLLWEEVENPVFSNWRGTYWGNRTMSGDPLLIRDDADIDFDWGRRAPAAGLPEDDYSVRWRRDLDFEAGTYRFTAQAAGGIRVYMDGELLIDEWQEGEPDQTYEAEIDLAGLHRVRVDFFDRSGRASVNVSWAQVSAGEGGA
jgi:hypothetical protein